MKKTILLILTTLLAGLHSSFALSWEIDLTTMTPKQVLEFYKKNPDHWKKRLKLNYNEYIKWEYVVFRWEYKDSNKNPIPNKAVNYSIGWEKYSYVTSEEWIFNLEVLKEDIKDNTYYTITTEIDWYNIKSKIKGSELKEKSIYHFEITRIEWNPHTLSLKTIYNPSFWEWTKFFKMNTKIKKEPSSIWIQWIWLYFLFWIITLFITFFYFKNKGQEKGDKKNKHT